MHFLASFLGVLSGSAALALAQTSPSISAQPASLAASRSATLPFQGPITVFNDSFTGDTIQPVTGSYPAVTATTTGWEVESSKLPLAPIETGGAVVFFSTKTSGAIFEAQALFTGTPVTVTPGGQIEMTGVFLPNQVLVGAGDAFMVGLFNSGRVAPIGLLGATSAVLGLLTHDNSTLATGGAAGWVGYNASIAYAGGTSYMATRAAQTGPDNLNQDVLAVRLAGLGSANSGYGSPAPAILGASNTAVAALTNGNAYTFDYTLALSSDGTTLTSTLILFSGAGTSGAAIAFYSATAGGSNLPTTTFDSMAIGWHADNNVAQGSLALTGLTVTIRNGSGGGGPVFTAQPASQSVVGGSTVVFNAAASGSATYQWQRNGVPLFGATSSRLVIGGVTAADAGIYTCVATNSAGWTTSSPAALSLVSTTDVGRLVNLSVLTTAGKSQLLTVGFVIGGAGTGGSQSLLIRATGPALSALGVSHVLPDPTLTVFFSGQTVLTTNDNWGFPASNQLAVSAADTATQAFPLNNPASLDAALVASLPSIKSGYSVQIGGNTAALGTALAEVYDNTPAGGYTPATPRLINVSSSDLVAANDSLTAGFVVGGATSRTVLVRVTGPALALLGVSGTMPDPQVALHTTVNGQDTVLLSNAGWGGDPQITAVDASVSAFALTNPSSKDSVVIATLAPGNYTAVATSATGTAGVALIEIYEVP